MITEILNWVGKLGGRGLRTKTNRAARVIVDRIDSIEGVGDDWARTLYADYMTTSAAVHAAVRVRSEAVGRPCMKVLRRPHPGAAFEPAPDSDPLQSLLDHPNRHWSRSDLWRATESHLLIWGSAFWGIERSADGAVSELWPLRPDNMRVLPDQRKYVRGFVYDSSGDRVAYLPDEVAWFRHLNPLDEFAGLSSVAPSRLSIDMAYQALQFNRDYFANSAMPADLAITIDHHVQEDEINDLMARWEQRYRGAGKWHRPGVLARGMDIKKLGVAQRDMEFLGTLDWSVAEVSRSFGVPKVFLSEFEDATRANVDAMERFLWRNTVVPELKMLEDTVARSVVPLFESFPGEYAVRFDLSEIEALREDANQRVEREVALINAGVITPAEVRSGYGMG